MRDQVFKFNSRQLNDLNMVIETTSGNRIMLLSSCIDFDKLTLSDDNTRFLVETLSELTGKLSNIDNRPLFDDILDVFTKQDNHNVIQPIAQCGIEQPII